MTKILHITSSIRRDASISNQLGKALVEGLLAKGAGEVTHRDLATETLPFQSSEGFEAGLTPADERTPEQAELAGVADTLISELQAADTIIISSPIYNFGVPASVKAWADLVARAGTTFQYTPEGPKGLLNGKKAYITVASGGTPVGSDMDYMSSWLTFFLGFIGITQVEVIAADGVMGGDGEAKIAAAHAKIAKLTA